MKVIIAGSRDIHEDRHITDAIAASDFIIDEVVCGMARGVDSVGRRIAQERNIPVKEFPADWDKYKKAAGFIRNREMAEYGDALILVWNGYSKGSANMLLEARKRDLEIFEYVIGEPKHDLFS